MYCELGTYFNLPALITKLFPMARPRRTDAGVGESRRSESRMSSPYRSPADGSVRTYQIRRRGDGGVKRTFFRTIAYLPPTWCRVPLAPPGRLLPRACSSHSHL
ncbi:hypothetical protein EVAR_65386_1 [Eumeta japonica]|uniref:Uncharacterized protein n=1 Tax=Eumeta variegata TaxID=151549 RepID=A0A4C2A0C3_EUMVA|nr:hypothetical protein EVAR_65386_1 [Eumeta japonica]